MKRKALFKKLLAMGLAATFALSSVSGALATEGTETELGTEVTTEAETSSEMTTEAETQPASDPATEVEEYSVETQEAKAAGEQLTAYVSYRDGDTDKMVGQQRITVDAENPYITADMLTLSGDYEFHSDLVFPIQVNCDEDLIELTVWKKPVSAQKDVTVHFYVEGTTGDVGTAKITVGSEETIIKITEDTVTVPEGYELAERGDFWLDTDDSDLYIKVTLKEEETPDEVTVTVKYVDEDGNVIGTGSTTVKADATHVKTNALTDVPGGYEIIYTGDALIKNGTVEIEVRLITQNTKTINIYYVDKTTDLVISDGNGSYYLDQITVEEDVDSIAKIDLAVPTGYALDSNYPDLIPLEGDTSLTLDVWPVAATKTISVIYWDIANDKELGTSNVTVDADANNVNASALTDIPEGYELVWTGDLQISGDTIYVQVRPVSTTKEIGVNYWDVVNNEQVTEGKVTVDADAYNVNTSALTDIPEGYELVNVGDVKIDEGWIYVEVRPVTTKEIGVNYWDVDANVQAGEGKVTVDIDATTVNTTTLTDVPEGYEVIWLGDTQINDGWIFVEVRKVAETKTVGVNYYSFEEERQIAESSVEVAADAIHVNTSLLTDVPEGYELVEVGDLEINDGWIFAEVRKASTKTVGVNYYSFEEGKQIAESSVEVPADAVNVNTSLLTDVPEGYELVWTGDLQINDGWIFAEVRKAATTKIVGVNYFSFEEYRQIAESSVEVPADAVNVNTSLLTDVPEGYELVWTGDLQINDGWIFAEVRKAVTTKTVDVKYYIEDEDRYIDGQAVTVDKDATYVNTTTLTDVPEGYEIVWLGDEPIRDGQIIVEIRKTETTKEVAVVYNIEAESRQITGQPVKVDKDATYINTSILKDVPEGYEIVWVGDLPIENDSVLVELRAKKLDVYFVITDSNMGGFVDYEQTTVSFTDLEASTGTLYGIPAVNAAEGYEFAGWGDEAGNIIWNADQTTFEVTPGMGTYLEGAENGTLTLYAQFTQVPAETESETTAPTESETTAPTESETTPSTETESETVAPEDPTESEEPDTTAPVDDTEEDTEEETTAPSTDKKDDGSNSSGTASTEASNDGSVKTGDNTPIGLYAAVMLVAGAVVAAVLLKLRRRTY